MSKVWLVVQGTPPPPTGPQYYCSTSGNNANNGTSLSTPWLTLNVSCPRLSPGDTLNVHGNYNEALDYGVIPSGTSGNPITIRPYPAETVTIAPVDGSITAVIAMHADWVNLTSLILDAAGLTNLSSSVFGLSAASSNHCNYTDVTGKNATGSGISSGGGSFNRLLRCIAFGNGQLGSNQYHGFYITGSSPFGAANATDNILDQCISHDNAGFNFHCFDGTGKNLDRLILSRCRAYRSGFLGGVQNSVTSVAGMLLTDCTDGLIYDCLSYSNLGAGIVSAFGALGSNNLGMFNNTVYNNGNFDTQAGINLGAACSGAFVQNNIDYLNGITITNSGSGNTLSNNPTTDPGFVDVNAGNFHIGLTGPAYQTGLTKSSIFTTDFDGTVWVVPWDCGALKAS